MENLTYNAYGEHYKPFDATFNIIFFIASNSNIFPWVDCLRTIACTGLFFQ